MKVQVDPSKLVWQRQNMARLKAQFPQAHYGGALYHGTGVPPEEVFTRGIPATGGENFDLVEHQRQSGDSALRGSCTQADIPALFAGEGGFVYKLYPVGGGVDVNAALGEKHVDLVGGKLRGSIMPGENEVAFASYQPPCQVEGYYPVGEFSHIHDKYRLGKFVPNPHFEPGAWENRAHFTTRP